jgi:dipeptidyl aminopeptidase/acylaminoacyl peptidase
MWRYADCEIDTARRRLICVREDHTESGAEPVNTLVSVPLEGGRPEIVARGHDFFSSPRLRPDGKQLVWLSWDHPNMPWDGTDLWLADVGDDGSIGQPRKVAGGRRESIFQPEWSPDGVLHFVSDRTGWWNIYRAGEGPAVNLAEMSAEFGFPQWIFGMSTYSFASPDRIICAYGERGLRHLASLDIASGRVEVLEPPYADIEGLRATGKHAVYAAGTHEEPMAIILRDLDSGAKTVLRRSHDLALDPGFFSRAEAIEFPTEGGKTAHAFYYAPVNPGFEAPPGEKPPLVVMSHGGPTAETMSVLSLRIQFWTTRGFAVVDVNYGGSTGHGREYRERLNGRWGLLDVDDCVNAAKYLAGRGSVDPERLVIRGGSAGGYTTLCALTFRDDFKAGASFFGISDLEAMVRDTHKFESRYLDTMVGPYPDAKRVYEERSPIHFVDKLSCPVIFLQGLEDRVVPPNQAEMMVEALRVKGIPVAYVPFPGEQHGFRRAENIKRSFEAELYFYCRIFGIEPADDLEPVEILNL